MTSFDAIVLVKTQILTLSSIISERGVVFEPLSQDELDSMSLVELERVRKAYRELALLRLLSECFCDRTLPCEG